MFSPNPINENLWNQTTSAVSAGPSCSPASAPLRQTVSNQEDVKKRKRTSLLSGLASKFSRKKSAPTTRISNEEIWKATCETVHPKAARLGMNTFNFSTGGSSDGRIVERELSPGAIERRERNERSPHAMDDRRGMSYEESIDADTESDAEDDRGRHRSGLSAYSVAARKRASGYVARSSTSSSLRRETSYGSAQIATFTAAYPRQINTRIDTSPVFDPNASVSSVYSPVSSTGSSMQRNGSSIFDRANSRFDSIATDVTTPDISARPSKSSLPGKAPVGVLPSLWSGDELSPSIAEQDAGPENIAPEKICPLALEDDETSMHTAHETRSLETNDESCWTDPGKRPVPIDGHQKLQTAADLLPAPFVVSDLQAHQVRVQDFTLKTHVVQNAMDMAANAISPFPRKHRKSVFLEMADTITPPEWLDEGREVEDEVSVEVEQTLRRLSISALNGEPYPTPVTSPALDTVAEEDGPFIFGHKRSVDHTSDPWQSQGQLPLHEKAGERLAERVDFEPGHRRSRAVSLRRPKTIVVLPESIPASGPRMPGSYEQEESDLDEAVADECDDSDGQSSADFFDVGDGT